MPKVVALRPSCVPATDLNNNAVCAATLACHAVIDTLSAADAKCVTLALLAHYLPEVMPDDFIRLN